MDNKWQMTERELKEINLCMLYASRMHHGTAGHNRMMLIAKMAERLGFGLNEQGGLVVPEYIEVVPDQ